MHRALFKQILRGKCVYVILLIKVATPNGHSESTTVQSNNNVAMMQGSPVNFASVKDKLEKDILGLIEDSIKKDLTWDSYKHSILTVLEKDTIFNLTSNMKIGKMIKTVFGDDGKNDDTLSSDSMLSNKRRKYKNKKSNSECPHLNKKHYAKNKCYNCYHREGRQKKAWNCPHSSKAHYALGLCHNCYQNNHIDLKNRRKLPGLSSCSDSVKFSETN